MSFTNAAHARLCRGVNVVNALIKGDIKMEFSPRHDVDSSMPEWESKKFAMSPDPFGDLQDWRTALEMLDELESIGHLADCQCGLIRILNYKGNWRLREEVLKRLDSIQKPTSELVEQVLRILADDNIYYEARALAIIALTVLVKRGRGVVPEKLNLNAQSVIQKLCNIPQPSFFKEELKTCLQALVDHSRYRKEGHVG